MNLLPMPSVLFLTLVPATLAPAWLQGSGSISGQPTGPAAPASAPEAVCDATSLQDMAGTGCITASSTPTVGSLLPLGSKFNVTSTGRVGIGTLNPAWLLHAVASQGVVRLDSTSAANGSVIELRNQTPNSVFVGAVNFVNSAGAYNGQIAYESDDELTFRVGGSQQGKIGIGVLTLPGLRVFQGTSSPNVISGYGSNLALPGVSGGTIGGGGASSAWNGVLDDFCTVGGGYNNAAGDANDPNVANQAYASVLGGLENTASGYASCIGGGEGNRASSAQSFVGGGTLNHASGWESFIGAGFDNLASGNLSFIGGGQENEVSGYSSSVLGGNYNRVYGAYSVAVGHHAVVNHDSSFVFNGDDADGSAITDAPNQFVVRAGGVWLGSLPGQNVVATIPAGRFIQTSTGAYLSTGGTWTNSSDRDKKVDVEPLDPRLVLGKVTTLPIQEWSYADEDPSVRHAGPMAQDFHAAFGLGDDERHIATIDADGIALAAIQGLNAVVEEQAARIAALEARLAQLDDAIAAPATAAR